MAWPQPAPTHIRDAGADALRGVLAGDGLAVDHALAGLSAVEMLELVDGIQFLLETVEIQSRVRGI